MEWNDRILRRLKLRDLYILLAVVEERGIAKAGRRLAVSQPAISKAIANMESVLGIRLLDRDAQGIQPTPYGLALVSRGRAVIDELRQGVADIKFLADPTAGNLKLGATEPLAAALIVPVVDRLIQDFPKMTFDVIPGETWSLFRRIVDREIEFGVMRVTPGEVEAHIATEILFHDTIVVAAEINSPWLRRRKVQLADLMEEPWILPPLDEYFGGIIAEAFRAQDVALPRLALSTVSRGLANGLLSTGRYFTVLPGFALKLPQTHPFLKALPIDFPSSRRPIAIATLKGRSLSPLAQFFIERIRAVAQPLAKKA